MIFVGCGLHTRMACDVGVVFHVSCVCDSAKPAAGGATSTAASGGMGGLMYAIPVVILLLILVFSKLL